MIKKLKMIKITDKNGAYITSFSVYDLTTEIVVKLIQYGYRLSFSATEN